MKQGIKEPCYTIHDLPDGTKHIIRHRFPQFEGDITYGKEIIENIIWIDRLSSVTQREAAYQNAIEFLHSPQPHSSQRDFFSMHAKYPNYFMMENNIDEPSKTGIMHLAYPKVMAWFDVEDERKIHNYQTFADNAVFVWFDQIERSRLKEETIITLWNFYIDSLKSFEEEVYEELPEE